METVFRTDPSVQFNDPASAAPEDPSFMNSGGGVDREAISDWLNRSESPYAGGSGTWRPRVIDGDGVSGWSCP